MVKETGGDLYAGTKPDTEVITTIGEKDGYAPKVETTTKADFMRGAPPNSELKVGPITPEYDSGGTSLDELEPTFSQGTQVYYLVEGPGYPDGGARFVKTQLNTDSTLGYILYLTRVADGKQL